jgi:DNA-binding SARP family transcriptional activator/tetratricopeptide (TPR) repeat protein
MKFRILGPLEIHDDTGNAVVLSQPLIRSAICVLLLKTDQHLSSFQLQELLWDVAEGADRSGSVKTCVGGVRRVLTADRLPAGRGGYRIRLREDDSVDLFAFRDLISQAGEARGRGDEALAAELYARGLALWPDPPLPDLPETATMAGLTSSLLTERRLARDEFVEVRLVLGGHRDLIPGLRAWVIDEPLNEHLWAQLMLALYRSGRKAEALQIYDDAQDALTRLIGVEPGPELQRLWHRIKVDDPGLAVPSRAPDRGPVRPLARQLPPDIQDFTGRTAEGERLRHVLGGADPAGAPAVVQITGAPGLGKTSLAVHAAHAVAAAFPDGQLYLQLAGASPSPRDPAVVLNETLRALGVAATDIPDTLPERAALYRSRLAGKRVLIVADDAAGPEQVQPLLPGTPGCAMVVTSRVQTLNLAGSQRTDLSRLPYDQGVAMLGRIIGAGRVGAEPDAAERVVRACDGFPLALRIAGARLATRPTWPLAYMAGLLVDDGKRLDELTAGNLGVRGHIAASYESLDPRAQKTFRMFGLLGPGHVAAWVVAVLLEEHDARDVVEGLVDKCLLSSTGVDATGQPRYRMHDLLRDYAVEQLSVDPHAERLRERLTIAWLELVDHADARTPRDPYMPRATPIHPYTVIDEKLAEQLIEPDPALWLDTELPNLRGVIDDACAAGRYRLAMGLVLRLASHLNMQYRHDEAEHLWRTILGAAALEADDQSAAYALYRVALVIAADRARPRQALPMADTCIAVFESFGHRQHLARALALRAYCRSNLEEKLDLAHEDSLRALDLARSAGDPHAELSALRILGLVLGQLGRYEDAAEFCDQALVIARGLGEGSYQGIALYSLIRVRLMAGQYELLPDLCQEGIRLAEDIGHVLGAAYFHQQWGHACQGLGHHAEAITHLEHGHGLFMAQEALAAGAACSRGLADSLRELGRYREACVRLEHCIAAFAELDQAADERSAREALRECRSRIDEA